MCATSYFLVRFLYINYNNNIPPSLLPPSAFLTRMGAEHRLGRGFHRLRSEPRSKKGHGVFPLANKPRSSIARTPQPMGGEHAKSYYGALSNQEASGEERNRSDLKRGESDRGDC